MKEVVRTEAAPAPFQGAPYSQAIRAERLRVRLRPARVRPDHAEIVGERITEQTEQVFANLARHPRGGRQRARPACEDDRLSDRTRRLRGMNEVYARHVGDVPPARATIEVLALPSGAKVEIEAIALAG